jgi:hypothetical protein
MGGGKPGSSHKSDAMALPVNWRRASFSPDGEYAIVTPKYIMWPARRAKVRAYFRNISDRDVMLILVGFSLGAVTVSLSAHFLSGQASLWAWADSFFQNFGTEMFGAFLTFLLIEVLVSGRREREAESNRVKERGEQLIRQLRSSVNAEARRAAEELRARGWLMDGALRGADLHGASLQEASLYRADLQGANLLRANLQGANLREAALQGVRMQWVDIRGANLRKANLQEAHLGGGKVEGAILVEANLAGTIITVQQLKKVHALRGAITYHGSRYDGRYNLAGDLEAADEQGVDRDDPQAMASFYGVPVEEYLAGQSET